MPFQILCFLECLGVPGSPSGPAAVARKLSYIPQATRYCSAAYAAFSLTKSVFGIADATADTEMNKVLKEISAFMVKLNSCLIVY